MEKMVKKKKRKYFYKNGVFSIKISSIMELFIPFISEIYERVYGPADAQWVN